MILILLEIYDILMDKRISVPKFKEKLGFRTDTKRSNLMSKIRSKENKAEIALRKALWAKGIRYRKNYKRLPGSPDIVIKKNMLIVFVDGEFWHGHNWVQKKQKIQANRAFWIPKIERNMQRDEENNEALGKLGFTVIRVWENEIKKNLNNCVDRILDFIYKKDS